MKGEGINLVSQQEIAGTNLICVTSTFVVFIKPSQKIGRGCSVSAGCGQIEIGMIAIVTPKSVLRTSRIVSIRIQFETQIC